MRFQNLLITFFLIFSAHSNQSVAGETETIYQPAKWQLKFDITGAARSNFAIFRINHEVLFGKNNYEVKQNIDLSLLSGEQKYFISKGKIKANTLIPESFIRQENDIMIFNIQVTGQKIQINEMGKIRIVKNLGSVLFYNDFLYQAMASSVENFKSHYNSLHSFGYLDLNFVSREDENLETQLGLLKTVKLKIKLGETEEEIWLSPAHNMFPVQYTTHLGESKLFAKITAIEKIQ